MTQIRCLSKLINANEYPIIFIGSGISKRYLKNYPSWIDLLNEFWEMVQPREDFYAFLNKTKNHLKDQLGDSHSDLEYLTFIELGTYIEDRFNKLFFEGSVTIDGFTQKDAFFSGTSPFKQALAFRFSEYELKPEMQDEINLFRKLLDKSQIVLTTNYDTFAEDSSSIDGTNRLKKYVGQKGFFKRTADWGEIFKIHGCVTEPQSIVIAKEDYDNFDKNSVLISAKIISLLINSPIIFFGYSLTDRNVRKIIRDFSSSLSSEEKEFMRNRLIIVNRKEGQENITEYQRQDDDLECTYTVIETDNFTAVFNELLRINQGAYPSEVRKFQDLIKELIVDRGKKGSLKSLLISPQELDELGDRITDENLVVALGDTTYIFKLPDIWTFLEDFIFDLNGIHTEIALKFIASQQPIARVPIFKYLDGVSIDDTTLTPTEKERIRQRLDRHGEVEQSINTITQYNKIPASSFQEILDMNHRPSKEIDIISFNVRHLDLDQVEGYLKDKLELMENSNQLTKSAYRRLAIMFDILKYKNG